MFTPVTYTPAGIGSATDVVGDSFGSTTAVTYAKIESDNNGYTTITAVRIA